MLITHVCCAWRKIAIGTPTLWTDVHLEIHSTPKLPNLKLIFLQFKRSQGLPVGFTLHYYGFSTRIGKLLLQLIPPCADRLRRITLMFNHKSSIEQAFHVLQHFAVPSLEVLEISLVPNREINKVPIFCGGAPRLRTLRLSGTEFISPLVFDNIVALTLLLPRCGNTRRSSLQDLLYRVSHSLVHLRLDIAYHLAIAPDITPIQLPVLKSLDVRHESTRLTRYTKIPLIATPQLERLSLIHDQNASAHF